MYGDRPWPNRAAMLCNEGFDVYGFDTGDEPPGTLYHFYDDVQPSEKDDFGASKAFFKAAVEAQPDCIRNTTEEVLLSHRRLVVVIVFFVL